MSEQAAGHFDCYIGIDYSGAETPTSRLKALQLFEARGSSREVVAERVSVDRLFDQSACAAAEQPPVAPLQPTFESLLTDAPSAAVVGVQEGFTDYRRRSVGVVRDYLARESHNRSLGVAGEKLVVEYERHWLHKAGLIRLSERVEHVAATKGDGLGYDVLSYDAVVIGE